jgi:hypothetical protein
MVPTPLLDMLGLSPREKVWRYSRNCDKEYEPNESPAFIRVKWILFEALS